MKLQILCGMIAASKSTYSLNAARNSYIIINDDDIVKSLHAGDYTLYDKKLKLIYKSVENLVISMALAMNRPVIIDRGLNINIQGRRRWIALARSFDVICEAVIFKNEGPEVHARRRFEHDNRGHDYDYWLKVAEAHNKRYVEPTVEEGFDIVHRVSYDEIKKGKFI